MTCLVLADHNNIALRDSTARAIAAALKLDNDVHVLVAGASCLPAAEAAARLAGVRKVLIADAPACDHLIAEPVAALVVSLARTHGLKKFGEGRQAALFCYGMSKFLGLPVHFAQAERKNFDIVARCVADDEVSYVPVQLKEWVPATVNPQASLQGEIDKLAKYADSKDLVVAFYLNRHAHVALSDLRPPEGQLAELWFFWAADPSQTRWVLSGNLLDSGASPYEFLYPTG